MGATTYVYSGKKLFIHFTCCRFFDVLAIYQNNGETMTWIARSDWLHEPGGLIVAYPEAYYQVLDSNSKAAETIQFTLGG